MAEVGNVGTSSCLFCTSICETKLRVETNGKLIEIGADGDVLSDGSLGWNSRTEKDTPTIDFVVNMLSIPIDTWNEQLTLHGVTNETLTVTFCDRCMEQVIDSYSWYCLSAEATKKLEMKRELVKKTIFRSGPIPNNENSALWNSLRNNTIADLQRANNGNFEAAEPATSSGIKELLTVPPTLLPCLPQTSSNHPAAVTEKSTNRRGPKKRGKKAKKTAVGGTTKQGRKKQNKNPATKPWNRRRSKTPAAQRPESEDAGPSPRVTRSAARRDGIKPLPPMTSVVPSAPSTTGPAPVVTYADALLGASRIDDEVIILPPPTKSIPVVIVLSDDDDDSFIDIC